MTAPRCPECGCTELVGLGTIDSPITALTWGHIDIALDGRENIEIDRIYCCNCNKDGWDEFITDRYEQ